MSEPCDEKIPGLLHTHRCAGGAGHCGTHTCGMYGCYREWVGLADRAPAVQGGEQP